MLISMRQLLLLSVMIFAATSPALAGDYTACYEPWPPYAMPVQARHTGIAVDAIDQAMARLGHRVHYRAMPYARCTVEAAAGQVDIAFFVAPEAAPAMQSSEVPLCWWLAAAVVRIDSPHHAYQGPKQFAGATVGTIIGYTYPTAIETYRQWRIEPVADAVGNLRKLDAGRVDVVFEDLLWSQDIARQQQLAIRALLPLVAAEPNYVLYGPRLAHAADQLEQELHAMSLDGRLDTLYRQHAKRSLADIKAMAENALRR